MQEEKLQLEREAEALVQRLAAVMTAKYQPHSSKFDAETPIDKVLNVMHSYIEKVRDCKLPCNLSLQQVLLLHRESLWDFRPSCICPCKACHA